MKCPECGSEKVLLDLNVPVTFVMNWNSPDCPNGEIVSMHIPDDELCEVAQSVLDNLKPGDIFGYACDDCGATWVDGNDAEDAAGEASKQESHGTLKP